MVHEHPGVYSSYDASSVIGGKKTARILGAAAVSTTGTANEVVTLTSYAEGVSAFGEDAEGTVGMAALLAALYRNGAAVVKAVKVSAATPTGYEAAFAALEQEAVDVIVCDSTSVDVQLKLRASVEKASGAQRERIGVVSGGASETAAKLVERAGKLNSERMVLTAPGDVRMAAAAAAVIAGESDPSVPVNGAVLAGFSGLSASYDDTQVDTLVTGGVTPLECVSGEVSIVRGITTRTTTGGAADKTWRELTTVRIVDDVIPALRASLRARFVRSKNTAQVRAAIRSQVMVELENKRAQEIIDSFGEVSVKASEDDPTVCLVEFSFAVASGSSRWKAIEGFVRRCGLTPYFTREGVLCLRGAAEGRRLVLEEPEGVIEASYRDRRYGVLSEVTAVNRAKKLRQTVRNEAFLARGGSCRRVVYVPSRSVNELRYTGRYQIEKSAEDARELTVTLAGSVDAEPMDRVELSLARLGVRGTFRVSETLYTLSASGETTELTLWEV